MDKTSKSLLAIICVLLLALISGLYVFIKSASREKTNEKPVAAPVLTLVKDTISYHSKTLPPFQHAYLIKPDSLQQANQVDSANFYYQKAARQFEKEANWEGYVWALNQVGKNLIRQVEYEKALASLNEALEKGLTYLGKEHRFVSNTYFFLGEYFSYTKQPEEALEAFNAALAIRLKLFGEVSTYVAIIYNSIGDIHQFTRLDYHKAEEFYIKALKIRENIPNDPYDLAFNYYSLATTNKSKGDYDKALSYAYEALRVIESLPQNDWPYLESCYSLIANIYNYKQEYTKAIENLNKSVQLNLHYKGRIIELASYYNDLGKAYDKINQYRKAVNFFHEALNIFLISAIPDSVVLSDSYQYLGDSYKNLHQFDSSLNNYNKALQIRLNYLGSKHQETSVVLHRIGNLYQNHYQLDSALHYYQRAIIAGTTEFADTNIYKNPMITEIGNNFYLFEILSSKAFAMQLNFNRNSLKKDLLMALQSYQLADTLMQLHSRLYDREESKLFFTANQHSIYERAIDCAFLLSQLTNAHQYKLQVFHWMEKSKARILFESLKEVEVNNQAGIPDSIRQLEQKLKIDMAFYHHQLEEETNKPKPDDAIIQLLRSSIFNLGRQQEKLLEQLSKSYPAYFQIKYQNQPVNMVMLQSFARSSGKQMIEYFWGDSAVYALSFLTDTTILTKINKTEKLTEAVSTYLQHLSRQPSLVHADEEFISFTQNAHFLYQKLIEPLLSQQKSSYTKSSTTGNWKLIIIPDGPLASIPFESFLFKLPETKRADYKKLSYLIRQFPVSYAFSVRLLLLNQERDQVKRNKYAGLLAFSYSDIGLKRGDAKRIAGSARELDAIQSQIEGIFLKGENASESAFKKLGPQFSILHLAIHGKADQEKQSSSYLLFNQRSNEAEDGLLYPFELYNLNLQARLTVLSACETGVGKLYKGEGAYSIARGFAYAGCPAIVMSLWKANDQTTADLMNKFYKGIATGLEIDKSLYEAKIAFLRERDEITAHPVYWAAFVSVGNMQPIKINNFSAYFIAGGTILFIIVLTLLLSFYFSTLSKR